jgi:uncharacterized protein (TIRG00374 family)
VRPAVILGTNLAVGSAALAWVLHRFGGAALQVLVARPAPAVLAAFLVAVAACLAGYALRWRMVLGALGLVSPLGALTVYRAAGQSVSTLVPSAKLGGEPVRAWLLLRDRVPAAGVIASVVVDRILDMGASAGFVFLFAAVLVRRGVPELEGAFVSVTVGVVAVVLGVAVAVRRLRRGAGVVTAIARSTGLDRLRVVERQMGVLAGAEECAARLVAQPGQLGRAFAVGIGVNLLVLVEYWLLLRAFGLPAGPLAVVAAIFATGAAHSVPVPAGVGVLEGAQMFVFGTLGHPPEVGLAVGLAVRLRELVWVLPGLVYLLACGVTGALAREAAAQGVESGPVPTAAARTRPRS